MKDAGTTIEDLRRRAQSAFSDMAPFHTMYREAFRYSIPMRDPLRGSAQDMAVELYDITAQNSAMTGAGYLHSDLYAPGFFSLRLGPLAKSRMKAEDYETGNQRLAAVAGDLLSIGQTPEFDRATREQCVDLYAGQGVLVMLAGDALRPIRHVCLSILQCAPEVDGYGDTIGLFHRMEMSRRQIMLAFPNGQYDDQFRSEASKEPHARQMVSQGWWQDGAGPGWRWACWLDRGPIVEAQEFRTQPVAMPRYWRVPGEVAGRGPLLAAAPTARVLNTVMELTLKSAAIQLLGIWGFRPSEFNPSTVAFKPGAWWPMQATGGLQGPSVQRLDPANGRLEVSNLVLGELREQVKTALHDDPLSDKGLTPKSASEIVARLERMAQRHVNAFGRLTHETYPVIARRWLDLCLKQGFKIDLPGIDDVLVQVDVTSPMAAALTAHQVKALTDWLQVVALLTPQELDVPGKLDEIIQRIADGLMVPKDLRNTALERATIRQAKVQQQMALAQAALQMQQAAAQPQPGAPAR